jgi:hypothetical protein
MFTFIILSLICFFVVIFLFILNWYENKKEINIIPANIRLKSDSFLKKIILIIVRIWISIHDFSKKVFKNLPRNINRFLHVFWEKFSDKIDKYFEKIKQSKKFDK